MNLHITGHHVQITSSIREYVSGKMERLTKHFDHVIDVNVIMSVEKLRQKVEATVHVTEPTGSETQVIMHLAGTQVVGAFRERIMEKPGQTLHIAPDPALVHLFDEQTGTRLN